MGYTDLWEVLSSDVNPQKDKDSAGNLATAVITAPACIPELYTSSKRPRSPKSESEAKRAK